MNAESGHAREKVSGKVVLEEIAYWDLLWGWFVE
jgi:hypothetical protein